MPAKKPAEVIEVDPKNRKLFLGHFYAARSEYADVPSSRIRSAGKPTAANPDAEGEMWWMGEGPKMLQRWENWRNQSDWKLWTTPDGLPAIELPIFEDFGGVHLKMFIDRVFITTTGALIIVDLKSGSRTPASDLQLGFYAAGVTKKYGVPVHGGCYWMARDGSMTDIVSLENYSPELLAHYARQFQLARTMGIFPPHITAMCRACGVREYCVAYKGKKMFMDPDYRYVAGVEFVDDPEGEGVENDCDS